MAKAKVMVRFDIRTLACDDCAAKIKLSATEFPLAVEILIPSNPPVRLIVQDTPDAKAKFDNYIDDLKIQAKKWTQEDSD